MSTPSLYPNLLDRALAYLAERGEADEAALCSHLFGATARATNAGPWVRLLRGVLAGDDRFETRPGERWALRGQPGAAVGLAELEFVALAVRTDGPKPWRHRIVAVAAARVRGARDQADAPTNAVLGRWSRALRPETPRRLPAYLADAGLDPESLEKAPTFAQVAGDLLAFLGDLPLVGLDIGLAAAFFQFELRRAGRPSLTNPLVELASLADLVLPDFAPSRKPSLSRLALALGLPSLDERRPASLAASAADVGRALLTRAQARGFDGLADLLPALGQRGAGPALGLDSTRHRLLLDVAAGKDVPDGPGVYLLKDRASQALYVGKATSLRGRLSSYFTTDLARSRRMSGVVEATAAVETRPTDTELEAQLLEARLIAQLAPRFNVQRRSGLPLAFIRRSLDAGLPRPKSSPRRPPWASVATSPDGDVLGPVPTGEARRLLGEARRRFRLGARRESRGWPGRAEEAWLWLAAEAGRAPVAAGLTGADLRLWGLRAEAETPAPPAPFPAGEGEAEATPGDGLLPLPGRERAGVRVELSGEAGPPPLGEDRPTPPTPFPRREGEAESAPAPRSFLVVLGRAGWLGTVERESTLTPDPFPTRLAHLPAERERGAEGGVRADFARRLEDLLAAAGAPGPTVLAELGVALRVASREPTRVVRLGPLCDLDGLPEAGSASCLPAHPNWERDADRLREDVSRSAG